MKIVIEGKQIGQSDSTVYPVHISTKRNAVISEISGSFITVSVYNNNAAVKTINITKPATGAINLDLCVFAPLLPEVRFNSIFATQDIRIVDGSQTYKIFVLNQRANNYDRKFSTSRKTIPYSNTLEYFGGKGGEVVPVTAILEKKPNYCVNCGEVVSTGQVVSKDMNIDVQAFIDGANKRMAMSIAFDVNIVPNAGFAFISVAAIDEKGTEILCEVYHSQAGASRINKTTNFSNKLVSVKKAWFGIDKGATGTISNVVVEAGTSSDYTKTNLPASYTVGSGVGLSLENIGELIIGSESCVYERSCGLAVRWQGEHGGSESLCAESYKMQDQFATVSKTNRIESKLIQIDIPTDNKTSEYYNSLYYSSLIEVFTGTKWIRATCTNKAGAIYDNSNGINKTVITLKTDAWT